jgi:hypothetical protein
MVPDMYKTFIVPDNTRIEPPQSHGLLSLYNFHSLGWEMLVQMSFRHGSVLKHVMGCMIYM